MTVESNDPHIELHVGHLESEFVGMVVCLCSLFVISLYFSQIPVPLALVELTI